MSEGFKTIAISTTAVANSESLSFLSRPDALVCYPLGLGLGLGGSSHRSPHYFPNQSPFSGKPREIQLLIRRERPNSAGLACNHNGGLYEENAYRSHH